MSKKTKNYRIALTLGDPGGIGPEIISKAIRFFSRKKFPIVFNILGDIKAFKKASVLANLDLRNENISNCINFNNTNYIAKPEPTEIGGQISYDSIVSACKLVNERKVDAMVTGPISKESLHLAGHNYDGHTGLLASIYEKKSPVLMLANKRFSTVHVSTHVSLLEAIKRVKKNRILEVIKLGSDYLNNIGINKIKIGVCGLNPHSGENGLFGSEEIQEIKPAINKAKLMGMNIEGPVSSDVLFKDAISGKYNLVVAQYHDQGHIPVKLVYLDSTVNISLGLPIIRTSVDHGTAFDISWRNKANIKNMVVSILYACRMVSLKNNRVNNE